LPLLSGERGRREVALAGLIAATSDTPLFGAVRDVAELYVMVEGVLPRGGVLSKRRVREGDKNGRVMVRTCAEVILFETRGSLEGCVRREGGVMEGRGDLSDRSCLSLTVTSRSPSPVS
jgi:hypothetical protein